MGILRSDRVSGLGGANAINGSAHFQGGDGSNDTAWNKYIDAGVSEDYNFGTGDFTVECWINRKVVNNDDTIWGSTLAEASSGFTWYFNGSGNLRAYVGGAEKTSTSNSISAGTWYHVAITRASGTMQMWVDGVSKYSATVSGTVGSSTQNFIIGNSYIAYSGTHYHFLGHISNLRIQKGKAEYTAAFTAPTTKLEVTPETVLLACHDPGNVLAEATGKTLNLVKSGTVGSNSAGIVASRFVPDVGEDYGTTFADNTKFDTLSYMVPPGGTTTERGRGRGVVVAGENPSKNKSISYVQMQSGGIAKDFGDLTKDCGENKAVGSSTRGVIHLSGDNPATRDTLEYITFATTSNSTDFGDLNVAWWMRAAAGNQTRGIFAGGLYPGSDMKNDIDYITIATTGDATDFGNLTESKNAAGGLASSTRMIIGGGQSPASNPNTTNTIEYITIASTGNGTNFGDLTVIGKEIVAVASSTRGVFGPRRSNPAIVNTIDYITIATLGDAVDFGDGSTARGGAASLSNSTRGAWAGGYTPSLTNSMEYVDIATTGNAKDFGDLTYNSQYCGGCSDSHGGIS